MKIKHIDIHAHVNFSAYDDDRSDVVMRAQEAGVAMINVGTQKDTSAHAVALTDEYEHMYAIIGVHPIHTDASYHDTEELGEGGKEFTSRGEVFETEYYRELTQHPKVVGIGECGLDYYRTTPDSLAKQREAFCAQIELAIEADLPLMIHTRSEKGTETAYHDTLDILESYAKEAGEKVRGDFHFFAGSVETAKRILDLGFHCSFTGVITFARDYDEVVRFLPQDMLHAETDCPYVTPAPYRGKRNEPTYVREVVKALAEIRKEHYQDLQSQLLANAQKLFKIGT